MADVDTICVVSVELWVAWGCLLYVAKDVERP